MFIYQYFEETKTHVAMADLIQGAYQVSFQYMKIDEKDAVYTFYHSKCPSTEEEDRMNDLLLIMEKKYNVPTFIISRLNLLITN
jgi:hypothetical protein